MSSEKSKQPPLHADQRRAAALMAAGLDGHAVAAELNVSPKTTQRWRKRDDFRELVRKHRESLMPESVTAESVLTAALSATKKDGTPDWNARIQAARAILATPVTDAEARAEAGRVTQIFIAPPPDEEPEDDDGGVRPFPIDGVRDA